VLSGGENIRKYLATSMPDETEQQMFWEYFGYCMTTDTQFQKFLMLKGNGGTGKSVAVSLIQHIVGNQNTSSISLQDLNKRFFATGLFGKLLNACADIPCKAMESTDVLKKAVGEDTLLYEKKGQDAIHFCSYAKLLFSTNEMPQNLEDKSDAFYRRLLILDMNQTVRGAEKDLHLKDKVKAESDYAIHMAMDALKSLYERGVFTESDRSREAVREIQRSSDSICAFTDEMLVRAEGKRLKRSEAFTMYEEYCKENGRQGHGKSNFFKNMAEKGFFLKQYNGEYYYQDTAVKEEDFHPLEAEEQIPFEEEKDYSQLQLNMEQND
jgi:P4 family phage/plasmid primase-like protien